MWPRNPCELYLEDPCPPKGSQMQRVKSMVGLHQDVPCPLSCFGTRHGLCGHHCLFFISRGQEWQWHADFARMSAVCTSEPPAAKAGKLQKQETKLGSDSAMRGRRAGGAAGDRHNGFKILLHGQGCWHQALWGRFCVIAPEIRTVSRPIPGK